MAFCFLDYIATTASDRGRGIGGALYQRAREECLSLGVVGLFFECAPDDPGQASTPTLTAENAARLRFYNQTLWPWGSEYKATTFNVNVGQVAP